ncbi:DNA replication/repair protein RecF [Acholeplasma sp. OttesenSCG-928-E16]|nr:DNA replication/repair protein RecF [Acholeplasma sp. OttesenSCG-928-E16]
MIRNIELVNFRNHKKTKIKFNNNFVYIYGENGSGKTSIIEAIYFLSTTKSFRTSEEKELIKKDQQFTKVALKNDSDEYEIVLSKNGKRLFTNKLEIKKVSEYIGGFNVVVFALEDLNLIKGTPSDRRQFLDLELLQIDKEYLRLLNDYKKLLKQRNSLLKKLTINDDLTMLNILGNSLYEVGVKIYKKRNDYLIDLNQKIKEIYKRFSPGNIDIVYKPNLLENEFYDWVTKKQEIDIIYKTTMGGIHKDDFIIKMDNYEAKSYASNGEQRLIVIALKMALLRQIKESNDKDTILLLDDVLSELDDDKQTTVLENIKGNEMIIITSATPCKINDNLEIIMLKKGEV